MLTPVGTLSIAPSSLTSPPIIASSASADATKVETPGATSATEAKGRENSSSLLPTAASSPKEPDVVKELKKTIAELQKQLQEQQQAMQEAQSSNKSEEGKLAAVAAAQTQIAATTAALQTATAALLLALKFNDSSSSGSMVSTTA
ncbi:hypothetical protein [Pseudomonas gingeri]|uniref:hypothetical protein n=1 Tax=Pseudomonas gingeri TaxID=117681 RepID=UPI0015A023FB|nr:hypothetical protein [Pseudomonas gingeri]NWD04165.1 hypothetical protein [Pseudomonas gingeri]NWE34203.1 hypothetical protein [Pseudomonas gingeri]NWE56545.1 hypothetical protein [Pseudomonas gingeri]NWF05761.1 hypothetical protein [Pseudomonas gingeri]